MFVHNILLELAIFGFLSNGV